MLISDLRNSQRCPGHVNNREKKTPNENKAGGEENLNPFER